MHKCTNTEIIGYFEKCYKFEKSINSESDGYMDLNKNLVTEHYVAFKINNSYKYEAFTRQNCSTENDRK